jgi:ATP-dependent RNA helicase DeaD
MFRLQLEPDMLCSDAQDALVSLKPMDGREATDQSDGFAALGLDAELCAGLLELGFTAPTDIQRETIPALLAGRDVLGQAATGTGKTAAFALPMLHRLSASPVAHRKVRALVLAPTRELAVQVSQAITSFSRKGGPRVLAIYGGQAMHLQLRALERGVEVVVATPGRAMDHLRRGSLSLDSVEMVVLDEADEMLDMGFAEDIESILSTVPPTRQTALFSATLPRRILAMANSRLREPLRVSVLPKEPEAGTLPLVTEQIYVVGRRYKGLALARILEMEAGKSVIVFCRTRTDVDSLTAGLSARGESAEAIHGGLSQEQRDRVLGRFREGALRMLVATDVAARGLDIDRVSHVVNYDLPTSPEVYVHRIGRTGRAGREGTAITMVDPREQRSIRTLEVHLKRKLSVLPVPSVAESRAKRLAGLRTIFEAAGPDPGLDTYYALVDSLQERSSPRDVAAFALKLLDTRRSGVDDAEVEIPVERVAVGPEQRREPSRKGPSRAFVPRGRDGHAEIENPVKVYVTLGRRDGVRPGDLVGAIANLAGLEGRAIGAISLADSFSLVTVPQRKAEEVIEALRGATIRGKRVSARLDRDAAEAAPVYARHTPPPRRASAHTPSPLAKARRLSECGA